MTAHLEEVNRALNRSLRSLSDAANSVSRSNLESRMEAVDEIARALELVMQVQQRVFRQDSSLEYHHDPQRPPTEFMRKIASAVEASESALRDGKKDTAKEWLEQALAMEPSPLAYESIAKRLSLIERESDSAD